MKYTILYLPVLLLFITSCGFTESKEEAKIVMDNFFEQRIENGTTGDEKYYSDIFLDSTSSKEWDRIKSIVNSANGKILSYEQSNWQIQNKANASELSGTYVYFSFNTAYENGEGTELITLFKNDENPTFKIIGHNFKSTMIVDFVNNSIDNSIDSN